MNASNSAKALQELLASDTCVVAGSAFDPLSARIAHKLGFRVAALGGSIASLVVLGAPDLALLTLSELAEQTRRTCRATDMPVIIDADHGYGNALQVRRCVEEIAAAGAAGITIEDCLPPAGLRDLADMPRASQDEATAKLTIAAKAGKHYGITVIGRTDAAAFADSSDLIARIQAYQATGIDALFISKVQSRQLLDRIAEATRLPLVLGLPGPEIFDLDYLATRRVRICVPRHHAFHASILAIYDTARVAQGTLQAEHAPARASSDLIAQLSNASGYA